MKIKNVESKLCIDAKFKPRHSNFGMDLCQSTNKGVGGEQVRKLLI
jgi:hypothetical protein